MARVPQPWPSRIFMIDISVFQFSVFLPPRSVHQFTSHTDAVSATRALLFYGHECKIRCPREVESRDSPRWLPAGLIHMGVILSLFSQFGQAKKSEGTQSLAHLPSSNSSYCHSSMR